MELLTRLDCAHRFSELLDAANQGTGLAELHNDLELSEVSNYASSAEEAADYEYPYGAPTEGEEPGPNEREAEDVSAEDYPLEYEATDIEDGFAEDTQPTDAGNTDMLASNFEEEVQQAELGHGAGYLEDNASDAEYEIDYREREYDEAAVGEVNTGESSVEDAADQAKEDDEADEFDDEIGVVQAEAASASVTTGNDHTFIYPFHEQGGWQEYIEDPLFWARRAGSVPMMAGRRPFQYPWTVDDGLIDYSDDEAPGGPFVRHEHLTPPDPHAPVDDGSVDYSDDEPEPEPVTHIYAMHPMAAPQGHSLGLAGEYVAEQYIREPRLVEQYMGAPPVASQYIGHEPIASFYPRHTSSSFSSSTSPHPINADSLHFQAHADSIAQPDPSFDVTGGAIYEGEPEQIGNDYNGQIEDTGAVENSEEHEEATPNGVDIVEPSSKITQPAVESPTSTIKGDEISYEDQDLGDGFDVDLQEPEDPFGKSLDEIDWDQDGEDDKIEGIEEQDPNKLTPSSASTKRSRQPDDPNSLADESGLSSPSPFMHTHVYRR